MPQIFQRRADTIVRVTLLSFVLVPAALLWAGLVYTRSSYGTNAGIVRVQPVPFSHEHHVGVLGIDCRYCHTSVEHSPFAGIPPTKTCMNCHSQMWVGSDMLGAGARQLPHRRTAPLASRLQPARLRLFRPQHPRAEGRRLLHLPRRIDEMPFTYQEPSLLMEWCLDCHRASGAAPPPARRGVQHEMRSSRPTSSSWDASS